MAQRLELHEVLLSIQDNGNVYFQPDSNVRMKYPCIVYHRDTESVGYADNKPYRRKQSYTVTVIDRNPDSPVLDKIGDLPLCRKLSFFVQDNLNHDVYNLYH